MSDDTIEAYLIAAGHKPGRPVDIHTLREAFAICQREAIAAVEEIQARYPYRPGIHESMGDALIRQGRNTALSCVNAIKERLQ